MGTVPSPSRGYRLGLMAAVVVSYGLIGLTPMVHEGLWMGPPLVAGWNSGPIGGQDKLLHAIWGLYVTLAVCVGLAPLGRWASVPLGLAGSVGMAVAAEFVQKYWLVGRQFEWLDVAAYASAGALVATGLLLAPFPWRRGSNAT